MSGAARSRRLLYSIYTGFCFNSDHLQALTFDASCQHHMCSIILGGVCHSSSCTRFQVMSMLCKQLSLRATKMCPLHAQSFANALLHSPYHTTVTPSPPYCRDSLRTSLQSLIFSQPHPPSILAKQCMALC